MSRPGAPQRGRGFENQPALARWLTGMVVAGQSILARLVAPLCGVGRDAPSDARIMAPGAGTHVLVVRLDETIGDSILLTPMLRELRHGLPGARITLVIAADAPPLLTGSPYVDDVLRCEARTSRAALRPFLLPLRMSRFGRRHFTGRPPDVAISPVWGADRRFAGFLMFFSGARTRIGYSEHVRSGDGKGSLNRGMDRLLTHALDDGLVQHEVRRSLGTLAPLGLAAESGAPEAWPSPADRSAAQRLLAPLGDSGRLRIAVAAGAADGKRRWPAERYRDALRTIARDRPVELVVVGAVGDRALESTVRDLPDTPSIGLSGEASVLETLSVLARCDLFVGNDSGPAHLAAAAGVPAVVVSCHPRGGDPGHANSPVRFSPWGIPSRVLQPDVATAPCRGACSAAEPHCILAVDADSVAGALRELAGALPALRQREPRGA